MGRTEGPDSGSSRPNRDRRGPRSTQSRTVLISKALSRLLRHQAQNEGVPITDDGWVRLDHLFAWRGLSGRNGISPPPTVEEIWAVVEENEKKRFAVRWVKESTDPSEVSEEQTETETNQAIKAWRAGQDTIQSHYLIRATQGHSIKTIASTTDLMKPITLSDPITIPSTCVHGTFYGSWPLILKSGGLKAMGRNHVHFATGPTVNEVLAVAGESDETEKVKVISGMRHDAQILIYVDLKKCLEDVKAVNAEMEWWRSENGVILTAGVDPAAIREDVGASEIVGGDEATTTQNNMEQSSSILIPADMEMKSGMSTEKKSKSNAGQKGHADTRLVPMKYWTVVVEVKKGLGVLWKQGEGVVQELPAHLLAKGTTKGSRGGGRGGRRGS